MKNTVSEGDPSPRQLVVLVADAHALIREGIKLLVASILGDVTFLEADNGDALLRTTRSYPGLRLALVDLRMPGMQGGIRLADLAREHPDIPLVVVSTLNTRDVVQRVLDIPTVHAFVPKSASAQDMRAAIEAAMQGRKLPAVSSGRGGVQPATTLTPRQEEIRRLLRQGMSNKMIASALGISEGTVKNHVTDILRALNATNRTQAAQHNSEAE